MSGLFFRTSRINLLQTPVRLNGFPVLKHILVKTRGDKMIRSSQPFLGIFVLIAFLLSGCSYLEIRPSLPTDPPDQNGLPFWRPAVYLWIGEDKTGNCTATVQYLPDPAQKYLIIPHYRLGSLSFKPTLKDGWNLTSFDSTVDTKIPETLASMLGVFPSEKRSSAHFKEQAKPEKALKILALPPGLYRLDLSGATPHLDTNHPVIQCAKVKQ